MSSSIKITVIGAGSAQFSLGLVRDLCLTDSLSGSLVCFMDTNPDRLDMIHQLATRYANELGSELYFEKTTDRAIALQESDFVINTVYVKGHNYAREAREVATEHGYYYTMGSSSSMDWAGDTHQLKIMLDVAQDMEVICPDAWLIQSSNPVFEGCTLMSRETDIKVCGLCHGHFGVYDIAREIGLPNPDDLNWQAPGLNHNIWLTHFINDGKDAYPLIDEWIEVNGEEYWSTHEATGTHDIQMSRGSVHQYQMYGLMPVGDTPRRSGWWYHTDLPTKKYWFGDRFGGPDTELARPFFVKRLKKRFDKMTELTNDPTSSLIEAFGTEKTKEGQVPLINGLTNDIEGQFQVNVPNRGAIEGIPDDVVVEVPAIVNKKGIQPLRVGSLPPKVMIAAILPDWLRMERKLLAFKTGDRSLLLSDILENQQSQSYEQAERVLDALIGMEGNEEMKGRFVDK